MKLNKFDRVEQISEKMDISMESSIRDFIHSYYDAISYNGHSEILHELVQYILAHIDEEEIGFSDIESIVGDSSDNPVNIFYSILVVMYGDYGTSPRFGWIYANQHDDLKLICEFIIALYEWEKEGE